MNKAELISIIKQRESFLCVGLDTDINKIPKHLLNEDNPIFIFNKAIIDATAPYCIAYKPNLAFYESYGLQGWQAFEETISYLKSNYSSHFIIADAKRGDIGNTSKMYAKSFFENLDIDAVTVAPYMGEDSISPFLEYNDKWTILLALTSNKGSKDFQLQVLENNKRVFEEVINSSLKWNNSEHLMYVVGATQGKTLKDIRKLIPEHFLLVPGIGAQGGNLEEVCKYALTDQCSLIVNASRSIIYSSSQTDFAHAAATEAKQIQEKMSKLLKAKQII